ncbi:MAG TPA: hypothetical protein VMU53_19215, partial [Candidatus Sulfotelmatobacter sp.]|nr:hypothetical protein [Candidatus Sulfotelmatobacter sp.]
KELYELVWSEPMKNLCVRFGISDVALKKTCARADIPTPDRGYWAKKEVGKSTFQPSLPERPPGMNDDVVVGKDSNSWHQEWSTENLLAPLPPPPEFNEKIEALRERISNLIGKLSVPREVRDWHPAIDRLLKEDEKRREKQLATGYSWDAPLFETPLERRRLRILNTLFLAAARMGGKPNVSRDARSTHLTFYRQHVGIRLGRIKEPVRRGYAGNNTNDPNDTKLSFSVLEAVSSEKERISWQDNDSGKLEARITDIVVEVVLTAEIQHRESAIHHYQWRVERKADLDEEERKRKLEAERRERERLKRLEQGRIDRLLRDAAGISAGRGDKELRSSNTISSSLGWWFLY